MTTANPETPIALFTHRRPDGLFDVCAATETREQVQYTMPFASQRGAEKRLRELAERYHWEVTRAPSGELCAKPE